MEIIKSIRMTITTKGSSYEKLVVPNSPRGYTRKDIDNVDKWSAKLKRAGVCVEVWVEG